MSYVCVSRDGSPHVIDRWADVPNSRVVVSSNIDRARCEEAASHLSAMPVHGAVAFIDGSFDKARGACGCGLALCSRGYGQALPDLMVTASVTDDGGSTWQIAGECHALEIAIRIAGQADITVVYDCASVPAFALGLWRSTCEVADRCREAFLAYEGHLTLVHAYSHGKRPEQDPWLTAGNSWADELAAKGCAIGR